MTTSWSKQLLPFWLVLAAGCASQAPKPSAAVVSAAAAPAATAPAAAPPTAAAPGVAANVYFSPGQLDSIALIEPPPVAGSEAARADLQSVLDAQRSAHAAGTTARAVADTVIDCQRVAEVLVPPAPAMPAMPTQGSSAISALLASGDGAAAVAFATRAAKQVAGATIAPKTYWARARPYVDNPAVERLGDVAPDSPVAIGGGFERAHTSYPSGHTAFGTACAIVLAQMVPEQRAPLFARARLYGESRLIVGAHFPTDVDAGRRIGTAATGMMLQNVTFQADLRAARAQLRQALELPQAAP
jgi:acid phosphatase (class A)